MASILLVACAQPARELPPDLAVLPVQQRLLSEDRATPEYAMTCDELAVRRREVLAEQQAVDQELRTVQDRNQNWAIASALLFNPLILGMDSALPLRDRQMQSDIALERIIRIAAARGCAQSAIGVR